MKKRYQFYPSQELDAKLTKEAENHGIPVSALIVEILEQHFGLLPQNSIPFSKTVEEVYRDVELYLEKIDSGSTFELGTASPTLRALPMVDSARLRPDTIRSSIGKAFSYQVREGRFKEQIDVVRYADGSAKKSRENGATIYTKK